MFAYYRLIKNMSPCIYFYVKILPVIYTYVHIMYLDILTAFGVTEY